MSVIDTHKLASFQQDGKHQMTVVFNCLKQFESVDVSFYDNIIDFDFNVTKHKSNNFTLELYGDIDGGKCKHEVIDGKGEFKQIRLTLTKKSLANWPWLCKPNNKTKPNVDTDLYNETRQSAWNLQERKANAYDEKASNTDLDKWFQKLYGKGDEETRRAMMKSFTESGGKSLNTDWAKVATETKQ
jgi:hypothetical protein